ncbi:hypothetical protein ACIP5Y_17985 [Nocardia sp. NPDC088792]|uniref:hypothetical protein n=1 Tax=Nocardia sp. NPDC088792 TaxID=3364332 RepID=UPI0037FF17A4
MAAQIAKSLLDSPDFLRLGLMLALERRPEEPSARTMFLQVRAQAITRMSEAIREFAPELDDQGVHLLVTYGMAVADGLFIAKEIGGDSVDLLRLFDLHALLVLDAADHLIAGDLA